MLTTDSKSLTSLNRPVRVAGAGPAGLSAAITLARAGVSVEVHERGPRPGCRHHFDFQAIENWSSPDDVLELLHGLGLELAMPRHPIRELLLMRGERDVVRTTSDRPLGYLVQRGPGPDTLDDALQRQAEGLGISIHCGSKLAPADADIWATGPRAATGIVAGYTFETENAPLSLCLLDEGYAPGGYVYLLVADGKATLATVLLCSFERARACLEKASALLGERLHLDMRHVRRFGGIGQFRVPSRPGCDFSSPGEAGGFQDLLFGFGIRLALTTGHLAARSLLDGGGCQSQRREVEEILRASTCNRLLFDLGGRLGHRYLIRQAERRGPRTFLADLYRFGTTKAVLYPLARRWFRHRFRTVPGAR